MKKREEGQRKAFEAIEAKRNAQISPSKAALQAAIALNDVEKLNRALQDDAVQSNVQVPEGEEALVEVQPVGVRVRVRTPNPNRTR